MTRLLVVTAVMVEARGLARELGLARSASSSWTCFGDGRLEVVPAGLRASQLASRWPRDRPTLVVSAGTCGALSGTLSAGDLVIPRQVIGADGAIVSVDPAAHAAAVTAARRAGLAVCLGPLATASDVAVTPEAKSALREATTAVAADMESTVILAAAARRGIPALVVRAVADTADESLPVALAGLVDDAGRTRPARAAMVLALHPRLLASAVALRRATAAATRSVAAVLARLAKDGVR